MRVAVLGAGLQGACIAMELADAGVHVDLYERNAECLAEASSRNEGKIHLGYVYANDRTLETARTMIRGAAAFSALLRRWLGTELDMVPVSRPFRYAVHRDSILTVDDVARHLKACHAIALEEYPSGFDYFGMDPHDPPAALRPGDQDYDDATVIGAIHTSEIALDAERLAELVRARLSSEANIRRILSTEVSRVALDGASPEVHFSTGGAEFREGYDHVVNAAWGGRLGIDMTAGIIPRRPWLFRMKYYARVRAPLISSAMPSTTIVLGPFGDVVDFGNDDFYLSWYPAGVAGRSSATRPPAWPRDLVGTQAEGILSSIVDGLKTVIPAVAQATAANLASWKIQGGVIFAWGATDIDDPHSGLHERATIGAEHRGRYHSINTGKLTTAPMFGRLTAARILAAGAC